MKWTKEQQNVIDFRNRDILVAAAAGSGKTAVLVARIIQRILDPQNPVDIDRLLVVTFTLIPMIPLPTSKRNSISIQPFWQRLWKPLPS